MKVNKFITTIIFLIIVCGNLYCDSLFYYGFDDINPIRLIPNKVALSQNSNCKSTIDSLLSVWGLNWSRRNSTLCIVDNINNSTLRNIQSSADNLGFSIMFLPVYSINDEIEAVLFPEIILQPKDASLDLGDIIETYQLTLIKDGTIYKKFSLPSNSDPISIANEIYETGEFLFSYPHFFAPAETFAYIPNDTYFSYQITCHNTGQTINDGHSGTIDADIDAPEAWDITKGSPDIIVAVFDEGVTANHPDLPNSRQVRLNGSNFGSGNPNDPSPTGNMNHGNACAGVIAATMDNNEGIAGIAPNCKIMPLRWDSQSTITDMADGIEFAVDNGASVISCSWGYGTTHQSYDPGIISAIQYAINHGVVVVFAAGNTAYHSNGNHGYVKFPANANVNNLITVGASDRYDYMAEYSPRSTLIDVVAPSHRAYSSQITGETFEMWSIDIPGNSGYNPTPIDMAWELPVGEVIPNFGTNYLSYTGRFGGTSHACPVVAGVIALMRSVNPILTPEEIFALLTSSCDKVGGYSYVNGKCDELGYGRVNAYKAVLAAKNKYIQNVTYTSGSNVIESYPDIFAGYSVTNSIPYGNVIVKSGSNVTYKATNAVHLNFGFRVEAGGLFKATIGATSQSSYVAHVHGTKTLEDITDSQNYIESAQNENVVLTPNPANTTLHIQVQNDLLQAKIYTLNGQCVLQSTQTDIDVSSLPQGMYILRAVTSESTSHQAKFIKE